MDCLIIFLLPKRTFLPGGIVPSLCGPRWWRDAARPASTDRVGYVFGNRTPQRAGHPPARCPAVLSRLRNLITVSATLFRIDHLLPSGQYREGGGDKWWSQAGAVFWEASHHKCEFAPPAVRNYTSDDDAFSKLVSKLVKYFSCLDVHSDVSLLT